LLLIAAIWLFTDKHYLQLATDYNTTVFHEDISQHLQATVQLKDVSNAERIYRWIAALNMIEAKPVFGFGPNTFYHNYQQYTEQPFKTWVSNNPEHSTVHNYFLLLLVEQGVMGCVLFTLMYLMMLLQTQWLYIHLQHRVFKSISSVTGVILVMIGVLIFSSDLIETDKIGSLFWLCCGTLIILHQKLKAEKNPT